MDSGLEAAPAGDRLKAGLQTRAAGVLWRGLSRLEIGQIKNAPKWVDSAGSNRIFRWVDRVEWMEQKNVSEE